MRKISLFVVFIMLSFQQGSPGLAETPEELLQRLERGRNIDATNEQIKKDALQQQKRRELEEYNHTWKRYGNFQVNVKQWRQQKDGTWITPAKFSIEPNNPTFLPTVEERIRQMPPRRFDASLDALMRDGVISKEEGCRVKHNIGQDCSKILHGQWIGVNCHSLHVNKKQEAKDWGKWERPSPDSPEERLLIDRCTKSSI
jgi:hypothetical protein